MGDWTDSFKNILEGTAIIIGGIWAYYRFGLFRERFPSMEIQNGINYIGENHSEYLLELYCTVKNKGKVRKWIAPLNFELLFLKEGSPFVRDQKLNDEISFESFPENETIGFEKTYWVLPTWHIPFVDGESERRFQYLTAIPKSYKYLSLYTRFIDFNKKKKAIKHILTKKDKNTIKSELNFDKAKWEAKKEFEANQWDETKWDEKLRNVLSKNTDFYYAQVTLSIDSVKNNTKEKR